MNNYSYWNTSLVNYFTKNVPYGTKIYLSLDDDMLEKIGSSFTENSNHESWVANFCQVVRDQVVRGDCIDLKNISGNQGENGYPKCVAFLGLMILAATQMADEEEIDQTNYFRRLRKIMDLPEDGQTRPRGLRIPQEGEAPEVQLWKIWNQWLLRNGFVPTAEEGRGSKRYISYTISQTLLRNVDKDRLIRVFSERQWQTRWDEQTLFTRVANEYPRFPQHLRELIDNRNRYESLAQAIHETYEQWLEDGSPSTLTGRARHREWSRQLYAGLYRTEDFLVNIEYFLYPKQQKGRSLGSLTVQTNGQRWDLREDRPGWYLPIGESLSEREISEGKIYQINPNNQVEKLILPKRDFWILVPDPDNPESGLYANWHSPKLGEQFIILFRENIFTDLQRLRDECLINWEGDRETKYPVFGDNSDWHEVYQCQILSQAWDGVFLQSQELKDALQPTTRLSISLSGGLRVVSSKAWIFNYPPQITAFAFHPSVEIEVTDSQGKSVIPQKSYSSNTQISLNFPSVGEFIIKASCLGENSQRLIKLIDWQDVDMPPQS